MVHISVLQPAWHADGAGAVRCNEWFGPSSPKLEFFFSRLRRKYFAYKWEVFRMADWFNWEVYVQFGPIQMIRMLQSYLEQFINRNVSEPRELIKRQEQFFLVKKKPKAVSWYICNFNFRSVFAKLCGFHFHVPRSISQ